MINDNDSQASLTSARMAGVGTLAECSEMVARPSTAECPQSRSASSLLIIIMMMIMMMMIMIMMIMMIMIGVPASGVCESGDRSPV